MMKPVLDIALFRKDGNGQVPQYERQRSQKALLWFMEALCQTNCDQLRLQKKLGKPFPLLYESGISYLREDGTENWQDIYRNFELMTGDCEDLACHRVAELRVNFGRKASPFVTFRKTNGSYHYHALVWVQGPDGGRLEDPSRKLGMGWESKFAGLSRGQRDAMIVKMDTLQKRMSPKKLGRLREVG